MLCTFIDNRRREQAEGIPLQCTHRQRKRSGALLGRRQDIDGAWDECEDRKETEEGVRGGEIHAHQEKLDGLVDLARYKLLRRQYYDP